MPPSLREEVIVAHDGELDRLVKAVEEGRKGVEDREREVGTHDAAVGTA